MNFILLAPARLKPVGEITAAILLWAWGSSLPIFGAITATGDVSPQYPASAPDPWDVGGLFDVGVATDGDVTIHGGSGLVATSSLVGGLSAANGSVTVDGPGSSWTLSGALGLGNTFGGGVGNVSLSGAGSRLYVGADAAQFADMIPGGETAVVVAGVNLQEQVALQAGSVLHSAGSSYLAPLANQTATATVSGAGSRWDTDGNLEIGGAGAAWLTLSGGAEVSAGGTISIGAAGRVVGNGSLAGAVQNSGRLEPGLAIGQIDVVGTLSQNSQATIQVHIAGAQQFDTVDVTGAAQVAGALEVELIDLGGGQPTLQLGDSIEFLTAAGGITGYFESLVLPEAPSGLAWKVHYAANAVALVATLPGDFNVDGIVNGADLAQWKQDLGVTANSDADLDAATTGADFLIWQRNATPAAALHVTPEPVTLYMSAVAAAAIALVRRRWRRVEEGPVGAL